MLVDEVAPGEIGGLEDALLEEVRLLGTALVEACGVWGTCAMAAVETGDCCSCRVIFC